MPISSYVVFPSAGCINTLAEDLLDFPNVELQIAENKELAILVSETSSVKEEEEFQKKLGDVSSVQAFTYVYGQQTPEEV